MKWWKIVVGVFVVGLLGWIGWYITRPVPGAQMADVGRDHVTPEAVAQYQYNSNPPTSGPHLATWVKSGVYDKPQSEGELIHSLEHGYIIISYNCNIHLKATSDKRQAISKIYAHEEDGVEGSPSASFTDPTIATGSASTSLRASAVNESDGCKTLVKELEDLARKKKLFKLVVVPRPQLDTTIALTAWTYIDKFDRFDKARIERFIDFHRDQGPEKTME